MTSPLPPTPDTLQVDTALLHTMQQSNAYSYSSKQPSLLSEAWDTVLQWLHKVLWFTDDLTARIFYAAGLLVLAIALFWMWRRGHFGRLFYRSGAKKTAAGVDEDDEANIHTMDFPAAVEQARLAGDFTRAARLAYLWTLKTLTDQQRIDWQPHKTVSEYTRELCTDDFRQQTSLFLRIRYGNVSADETMFNEMMHLKQQVEKRGGASR